MRQRCVEDNAFVSLQEFLTLLLISDDAINDAHNSGLIDLYMSEHADDMIFRKDAAKILHLYLKNICQVKDEEDISPAAVLKDLYDCRVCADHIAQVFIKGIMKGHDYPGGLMIFDPNVEITDAEARDAISKTITL